MRAVSNQAAVEAGMSKSRRRLILRSTTYAATVPMGTCGSLLEVSKKFVINTHIDFFEWEENQP